MRNNSKQQQQHLFQIFGSKLFNSQWLFHNLLLYFFLIGFGFGLVVMLSLHLKNLSFNFQLNHSFSHDNISPSHYSSHPPPCAPPPPPSATTSPPLPLPPPPQENHFSPVSNHTHDSKTSTLEGTKDFLTPKTVNHNMTDEELLWRASLVPRINQLPFKIRSKVAFMFLIRGDLPLAPLWEKFFKGHKDSYSIYIHTSDPDFVDGMPKTSPFYGRRIPSKRVEWGTHSMVEAERRLLANALLDFSNQRFVLLSESEIPLFKFTTIYDYLINSEKSFVEIYDLAAPVGNGRYNRAMLPQIAIEQWRKGAQWFEIDRDLAVEVVSDRTYYPVFEKHCKGSCYSDEHYLPTFMNIKFPDGSWNRTLTWTDWSKGGSHPRTFRRQFVVVDFLKWMRNNGKKCKYNGKNTDICYLFARKFNPDALARLLRFSPKVMKF